MIKKLDTISKEEFCKRTKTPEDCWIFKKENIGANPLFWKDEDSVGRKVYYFYDNLKSVRRFKDMPEYGEMWMSVRDCKDDPNPHWSLWTTWSQY